MSRSPSVNSVMQPQPGVIGPAPRDYHQPCSEETKINWVKDVNNFEHKLSPFRDIKDPMNHTLDSTGYDFVAFKQSSVGTEPKKMVTKPYEATVTSKVPGSRMYYLDILDAMKARGKTIDPNK